MSDVNARYLGLTANQLAEIATNLESENHKLREQLDTAEHNRVRNARDYLSLCHENDRLRELVTDYERCTMHADCSRCEYDGKLSAHCPLSPWFPDSDELCELGIEVD